MNDGLTLNTIHLGDSNDVLKRFPKDCIDLIITSPPYANNRKSPYNGVQIDQYVDWFLPIASELKRVLKPEGSFILNIKERAVNGERNTYVLELIMALKQQGWLWTEEYMWHKKNAYPGKWNNRFRDAWERCLHFTREKSFHMYQDAVMKPVGAWAQTRLANLSDTDKIRDDSRVGSGFSKNISNWIGRDKAYPTNVLHFATESSNKGHSAAFPVELPTWFIKLFTTPSDVVLDPFLGSGTTAVAAQKLGRHYVGIEISGEYYSLAQERLKTVKAGSDAFDLMDRKRPVKAKYPAVIYGEKGTYGVVISDMPGISCATGSTVDEALQNAEVALAEFVEELDKNGEAIPIPSPIESVALEKGEMAAFVMRTVGTDNSTPLE